MTFKPLIQITVAALAIAVPLAASATAFAGGPQHRHAVRNHGHDDRVFVRGRHRLTCGRYVCSDGEKVVPRPIVRDHRKTVVRDHRANPPRHNPYHLY